MYKRILFVSLILSLMYISAFSQRGVKQINSASNIFESRNIKAIIVGISNYENIPDLNYADDDALLFYNYLVNREDVKPENIDLFIDNEITKEIFETTLDEKILNLNKNDLMILFFAGHGDKHSIFTNRSYLLLSNVTTNSDYNRSDAIEVRDIQDYLDLATSKGAMVMTIIDACHSGSFFENKPEDLRSNIVNDLNNSWKNHFSLTACGTNQLSLEKDNLGGGHGVFSFFFVNGLKGACDVDPKDNLIAFHELCDFVRKAVRDSTEQQQTPIYSNHNPNAKLLLIKESERQEAYNAIKNSSKNTHIASRKPNSRGLHKNEMRNLTFEQKKLVNAFNISLEKNQLFTPIKTNEYINNQNSIIKIKDPVSKRITNNNLYSIKYDKNGIMCAIAGSNDLKLYPDFSNNAHVNLKHEGVRVVCFNYDGSILASGSWMNTVKLWDTKKGRLLKTLTGPTDDIRAVAFNDFVDMFAAAGDDNTIYIWEGNNWNKKAFLKKGHKNRINGLYFLDNNTLISTDISGRVLKWNLADNKSEKLFSISETISYSFFRDNMMFIGTQKGNLLIYDLILESKINRFNLNIPEITTISSNINNEYAFIASGNRKVNIVNTKNGKIIKTVKISSSVNELTYNFQGAYIAGVGYKGELINIPIDIPEKKLPYYTDELFQQIQASGISHLYIEKLKAYYGSVLLKQIFNTLNPFINGDALLPKEYDVNRAKESCQLIIELFPGDNLISNEAKIGLNLFDIYEIIISKENSRLSEASILLQEIKQKLPNTGFTLNTESAINQELNKLKAAKKNAKEAIKLIPNWTEPKNNLGKSLFLDHQYFKAIKIYEEIIRSRPDLSVGYLGLANIYSHLEAIKRADSLYQIALSIDTINPSLLYNYGSLKLKRKQYNDVESVINTIISIDIENPQAYILQGDYYFHILKKNKKKTHFIKSLESYDKALNINPNLNELYLKKATVLYYAYYADLKYVFEMTNNNSVGHLKTQITSLCNKSLIGNYSNVEAFYLKALSKSMIENKHLLLFDKTKKAVTDEVKKSFKQKGYYPNALFYLALSHLSFENYNQAEELFSEAIKFDKYHLPSYKGLLLLYSKEKDFDSKRELVKVINAIFPESEFIVSKPIEFLKPKI